MRAVTLEPILVPLPGWRDPIETLDLLEGCRMPALLLSGGAGAAPDAARWSFLSADPFAVVRWSAADLARGIDPFRLIEDAIAPHRTAAAGGCPFAGGAIGFIGYGAGAAAEPLGRPAPSPDLPDLQFGLYAWTIAWDHRDRRWWAIATGAPERGEAARLLARDQAGELARRLGRWPAGPPAAAPPAARPAAPLGTSVPRDRYLAMVEEARRLIGEGEFYQVNLSQRLELQAPADPRSAIRGLARHSPAPFSAWIDGGEFRIASASPERFVSLRGARVECRPIKGTRPRGRTAAEDAAMARALAESAKDRAENVMIVDLVRNDLGRVCEPGSVGVVDLCRLESYASVHHLISIVEGRLAAGRDRADLLRALFPGGSMTGAPKVRAMQAIQDLEPVPRGVYAGALGYLSFCGGMDLSIVIRTVVMSGGRAWLSVGGGVVADSDPESEWRESLDKAASVLRGLAATGRPRRRPGPGTASRRSER